MVEENSHLVDFCHRDTQDCREIETVGFIGTFCKNGSISTVENEWNIGTVKIVKYIRTVENDGDIGTVEIVNYIRAVGIFDYIETVGRNGSIKNFENDWDIGSVKTIETAEYIQNIKYVEYTNTLENIKMIPTDVYSKIIEKTQLGWIILIIDFIQNI